MDFFRPFCRYVVIPAWAIYDKNPYLKTLKYLERSQYFDQDHIKDHQWMMIKKLLEHSYNNTSYYKRVLSEQGIHPNEIRSWDDFSKLPLLTKNDLRNQKDALFAPNYDKYIKFCTSGSTGIPVEGYRNKSCQYYKQATNVRSCLWSGYRLGERIYCLYGDPQDKVTWKTRVRRKILNRERFLNTLDLSNESMMEFARLLQKKPPSLLWGHAHNMYILANFLEKNSIDDIQPKGMYSAGMVLHSWERQKVEKVFKCKFQDRYGCEEIGLIATECKHQEGLHINTDSVYVEFIGKNGIPVKPGEPGKVVVTDLTNYVMPLIRYQMGDIGIPVDHQCSCGRTQPLIGSLEGREADFLLTPEGKAISGISLTDHFGASIPGVAQIQIVQEEINLIILNIVKDKKFNNECLEKIHSLVSVFFGGRMQYECNFVDHIAQEPSGKYRFTICKIKNPFM